MLEQNDKHRAFYSKKVPNAASFSYSRTNLRASPVFRRFLSLTRSHRRRLIGVQPISFIQTQTGFCVPEPSSHST